MPRGSMTESKIISLRSVVCASCQAIKRTIHDSNDLSAEISSGTDGPAPKKNAGDLQVSGASI